MTDENRQSGLPFFEPIRRYVPLAAWALVMLVVLFVPLRIIQYGYLPGDDALRHAAKAVSGKPWSDILVLNPVYQIDHEYGWNLLLEKLHRWANWDAEKLVLFSVIALFVLVSASVLVWLKRPESWLIALTVAMIISDLPQRFTLGRPFLITMAIVMTLLLWARHGPPEWKWGRFCLMTGLFAVSTFMHGAWYLWVLPLAAFFLAGQFRWGLALGASWVPGVLLGATLTGHPAEYLGQAVKLALLAGGTHPTTRTMVSELQPFDGNVLALVVVGALLILRALAGFKARPLTATPAFWLVGLGWVLGFCISRFWEDWGLPALMVLMAGDLELLLQARLAPDSFKRLGIVCLLAASSYLCITCDLGSRWSWPLTEQYLTADNPDLKGWMPDHGGIFYTVDMSLFYQTFYKNPDGDWRYMLGFEPTWMPKEDFDVYQKVLWNFGDAQAYEPWVKKMRPADRLVIRGERGSPPKIPQLEWNYGVSGIWIGRLQRAHPAPGDAPATIPVTEHQ
jgi:hypothetical protein